MGMVIVISLPLIIFSFLLGFGCYLFGREKGRKEAYAAAQTFASPAPPPGIVAADSQSSPPPHLKPHDSASV
ncbi:transmembrane protein [Salvia divinorum]|uniref:Transmembrane protein n=1 Tax=Salvia divinorum TaxID=28513 RepID=A0ABD1G3G7_SALDI